MAVATKVAALGVLLRLFDVALIEAHGSWGPALATLAAITILVGNVGALGQSSLKRMLAYSSVAQAGYMLAGVVVATQLGAQAMVFYLAVYLAMNMAAFAVIVAREREMATQTAPQTPGPEDRVLKGPGGDSVQAMAGLGRERPWLAWPMTISMLALAGIPATAGFIGKFYLIDAAVSGGYTWLGVVIVVGSMISLGYYLPVIATMWMGSAPATAMPPTHGAIPAIAGGSPELDDDPDGPASHVAATVASATKPLQPELAFVAILAGAATIFFGIVPQPLFNLVHGVGSVLGLL
jgi:NADH-quinone oxidoreductase subunit N